MENTENRIMCFAHIKFSYLVVKDFREKEHENDCKRFILFVSRFL